MFSVLRDMKDMHGKEVGIDPLRYGGEEQRTFPDVLDEKVTPNQMIHVKKTGLELVIKSYPTEKISLSCDVLYDFVIVRTCSEKMRRPRSRIIRDGSLRFPPIIPRIGKL